MTRRVLVLGGGIVGMLAAARHRDAGDDVTLVDTDRLGGLLQSDEVAPGIWADRGTHVPQQTGEAALDAWLFGDLAAGDWNRHDRLRAGGAFGGALDERTPFPDLNRVPQPDRAALEGGLLGSSEQDAAAATTSAEELDARFGRPIRTQVFEPLLRNWYGLPAAELGPGALSLAANRVVAFTPERTRELKEQRPDLALAWPDATIGASSLVAYYPTAGGCGRWIDHLRTKLDDITILEGTRVQLEAQGDRVVAASSADGLDIAVDAVVATIAPAIVLRMVGRPPSGGPPRFVRTRLVDLAVDRPFGTDLHYFVQFDPGLAPFRVTLYPNLRNQRTGPFVLTAEILGVPEGDGPDDGVLLARVHRELVDLGVISAGAELVHAGVRSLATGFPVPTPGGLDPRPARDLAQLTNVTSFGRAAGGAFLLRDVLIDAHRRLPGT